MNSRARGRRSALAAISPYGLGLAGLTLLAGCGGEAAATAQTQLGAEVYSARCAVCHDQDTQIGTRLDAAMLRSYRTARALYNYTSFAMPYDAPRSMSVEEYWAVTAHMLRSRGLIETGVVVGPENADSLNWTVTQP